MRIASTAPAEIEFDAERWRAGSLRTRGAMADDLVRRSVLAGLTRMEMDAELGPPDVEHDRSAAYVLWRGVRLTYYGTPHRLIVRFRSDGRASDAQVVELSLALG